MSDTPRTDAERDRCRECGLDFVPSEVAEKLERELREEQSHAMMAGSQNSALRLQLKDAEERASRWAKIADQRAIEVADLKVALAKHSSSATPHAGKEEA